MKELLESTKESTKYSVMPGDHIKPERGTYADGYADVYNKNNCRIDLKFNPKTGEFKHEGDEIEWAMVSTFHYTVSVGSLSKTEKAALARNAASINISLVERDRRVWTAHGYRTLKDVYNDFLKCKSLSSEYYFPFSNDRNVVIIAHRGGCPFDHGQKIANLGDLQTNYAIYNAWFALWCQVFMDADALRGNAPFPE